MLRLRNLFPCIYLHVHIYIRRTTFKCHILYHEKKCKETQREEKLVYFDEGDRIQLKKKVINIFATAFLNINEGLFIFKYSILCISVTNEKKKNCCREMREPLAVNLPCIGAYIFK